MLGIVYFIKGEVASRASVRSHDSSTKYSKTGMGVPCFFKKGAVVIRVISKPLRFRLLGTA
jgi:hypothetical protein